MRFVGRGHPAIRATHAKTLEFVTGADITERATCVVAVSAEPEPLAPMAGPVRVRIAVGSQRFGFDAVANSSWDPAGPAVIRRGPLRLPGTFATDATAAAAVLPRELLAELRDPDALVTIDVAPNRPTEPTRSTVVLYAADASAAGPDARLTAELERADEVIAEDAQARWLVGGDRAAPGPAPGPALRTLVVATRHLPGRTCPDRLADAAIDTVGLPPALAVAAACPSRGPLTFGADPSALRSTPAGHRLVLSLRRAELGDLLHRAANERGTVIATVAQEFGRPLVATPDDLPELAGADEVFCCLHPAPADEAVDPAVRAAVSALLADGVATRTAAKALAALTGWERRRAYDAVLAWRAT